MAANNTDTQTATKDSKPNKLKGKSLDIEAYDNISISTNSLETKPGKPDHAANINIATAGNVNITGDEILISGNKKVTVSCHNNLVVVDHDCILIAGSYFPNASTSAFSSSVIINPLEGVNVFGPNLTLGSRFGVSISDAIGGEVNISRGTVKLEGASIGMETPKKGDYFDKILKFSLDEFRDAIVSIAQPIVLDKDPNNPFLWAKESKDAAKEFQNWGVKRFKAIQGGYFKAKKAYKKFKKVHGKIKDFNNVKDRKEKDKQSLWHLFNLDYWGNGDGTTCSMLIGLVNLFDIIMGIYDAVVSLIKQFFKDWFNSYDTNCWLTNGQCMVLASNVVKHVQAWICILVYRAMADVDKACKFEFNTAGAASIEARDLKKLGGTIVAAISAAKAGAPTELKTVNAIKDGQKLVEGLKNNIQEKNQTIPTV
ncbi:MAG: hypothetical protein K6A65_02465 [Succinivibrionaceae bacterium]|nr:hypothetical protein [Succinivibrionaceae bacterium]